MASLSTRARDDQLIERIRLSLGVNSAMEAVRVALKHYHDTKIEVRAS